jgi:serine/threonine protein kinase
MSELVGQLVNARYRVVRLIGEGAIGSVYEAQVAHDPKRRYALKVLKPHLTLDPKFGVRFAEEAATLRRLAHPSIVSVHDHFQWHGHYIIVLSYIDGTSLAEVIDTQGRLSARHALAIFKTILSALDYAHQQGVIHRDLKPSNILIDRQGQALLCDFGIARQIGRRRLTAAGTTLGTPEYMSPEQIRGTPELDQRSDVYSAGVVLYEMLTGKVPFSAEGDDAEFAIRQQHLQSDPADPRKINPRLDEALARIVLKALRKDRERRFHGCAVFREAIERHEQGSELGDSSGPSVALGNGRRRYAVYVHPTLGSTAVKRGFSWPALFGNIAWMWSKGLYPRAAAWASGYLLLFVAVGASWPLLLLGSLLVLWLVPGFRGNAWRQLELDRRGYRLSRTVAAPTAEAAVLQVAEQR